ncbi:MAG: hypothetical protein WD830_10065 [Chloroflexota bacterium]
MLASSPSKRRRAAGHAPAVLPGARALDNNAAHVLLADLGFLLVPGAPLDHGAAYLLIALRPRPTRAHFDPERIEYWTVDSGRAEPAALDWPVRRPDPSYSWGTIRIVDRIGAANKFASFGGVLTVSRDLDVHAALFRSEAPILALGGHSGPAEPLATNVGAFLAVLHAAAGDESVRRLADSLSPVALYAAFLWRAVQIYKYESAVAMVSPRLLSVLRSEHRRLAAEFSSDEEAGRDLAARLLAA